MNGLVGGEQRCDPSGPAPRWLCDGSDCLGPTHPVILEAIATRGGRLTVTIITNGANHTGKKRDLHTVLK